MSARRDPAMAKVRLCSHQGRKEKRWRRGEGRGEGRKEGKRKRKGKTQRMDEAAQKDKRMDEG
jgi:hypothetical protein